MQRKNMFMWNVDVEFHNTHFNLFQMRDLSACTMTNPMFHSHSYYEIYFGIGNDVVVSSAKEKYVINKGTMFLIAPGNYHYAIPSGAENNIFILSFSIQKRPGAAGIYDNMVDAFHKLCFTPIQISDRLLQSIIPFAHVEVSSIKSKCKLKCLAYQAIYDLLDELHIFDSLPANEEHHRNQTSDLLMLEELINTREYSLKDIASYLGYSEKQTARMIEKLFGMSFRELSRTRRIEDIKKLLTDCPNMTIEQIAELVGFASTSSMYKAFRQSEGISPLEFRESALSATDAK